MKLKDLKKFNIPDKPGVYFFMKGFTILYIGKATNLKDRVKSYFGKDLINSRGPLIFDMVTQSSSIKFIETDSVLEALIKEANLIKKYQPKYNTKEKDNKSFNYVYITKDYKLGTIREKDLLNNPQKIKRTQSSGPYIKSNTNNFDFLRVFGPFPNGGQLKEALKIIRKFFPYIESKKGAKGREEFYKQIKLNPCDSEENKNNIKNIILFFEGKKKKIITSFKKEMYSYAKNKEFEKANLIKKKIFILEHINDVALIKEENIEVLFLSGPRVASSTRPFKKQNFTIFRIEAYDIAHMSGKNMVGVMVVLLNGEFNKNEYKKFNIKTQNNTNDIGSLKEILSRRFKHKEWIFPDLIVVDGGIAQVNITKKVLSEFKYKINVVSVVKDNHHKPKAIIGEQSIIDKYKKEILLVNNEAHRFAILFHKKKRAKGFLSR